MTAKRMTVEKIVADARARGERPDLRGANLSGAFLRNTNLSNAYMRGADLHDADLRHANLIGANLDYSCLPLWCGSKMVKVDTRTAAQLAAHFCALVCDDPDYLAAREALLPFARKSHRATELGLLDGIDEEEGEE